MMQEGSPSQSKNRSSSVLEPPISDDSATTNVIDAGVPRHIQRTTRIDDKNFETFALVWCNVNVNKSEINLKTQLELRETVNFLRTFDDNVSCELWLRKRRVNSDDKIIFITSDELGKELVPKVHDLSHLVSIYIFCADKCTNENWSKPFSKIRAVVTKPNELVLAIKSDLRMLEKLEELSSVSMSIYDTSSSSTIEQSSRMLNGNFLWFRLFIETLIHMQHKNDDRRELIELFTDIYAGNDHQLQIIQEFERAYTNQRALWWYTRDSCIYKMLNKALRSQDLDTLIAFRTFITDIYSELKHLQENENNGSIIRVYRGQLMSAEELQRLKTSIGQYVSMNSFISTTLDRNVALFYITPLMASAANHFRPILLDIEIDKSLKNVKPYGNISSQSHFIEENEILFMVGSIFKIQRVIEPELDGIWTIKSSLCSENDHELKELVSYVQKEMLKYNSNLISLGNMLREICEYEKATKCFQRHLCQLDDENSSEAALCYTGLGDITRAIGDYDLSVTYHKKALEIHSYISNNDQPISIAYNKLGAALRQKKQYEEALKVYQECLQIEQRKLNGNPESEEIATTYYNMGILYEEQDKFHEALDYYNKSLLIRSKYLPSDHYKIARIYRGMGETYYYHGDYELALENLTKSLEMSEKSRTETHYDLGLLFHHIGRVYEDIEKHDLALENYMKADKIYRHAFPSTHEWVIENQQHIDSVSTKLK
ncbi:unnamed protein product [Adineta steineri]|uniref:ADP ribosyltransferase domain-containing protein n=1 Tax=Adineta steineri TaxID=433720 RepID=A0A814SSD1_9BILA|nr:unnamed protein product [Adineta steineri]CAF0867535.1 unnamed protein product [Adineta steineri]CAF1150342.1 unnamed protein product [Adineta steineri]CAF3605125.1 unnamed protein product [Adineta steineri]CAF3614533.1 unnamed protein product [Adineta steineri]